MISRAKFKMLTIFYFVVGILVSVKTRADQKVHKLKESYDHLVQRVTELQERSDKLVMSNIHEDYCWQAWTTYVL